MSVIVSGPSIPELVDQLLELLDEQPKEAPAVALTFTHQITVNSLGAEEAEQLLASLDDLSSEQIDSLLAEMLNESG